MDSPLPAPEARRPDSQSPELSGCPDSQKESGVPHLFDHPLLRRLCAKLYDDPARESTLYDIPVLNVVFVLSSLLLLGALLLVLWQDHDRPWKRLQRDFRQELARRYEAELRRTCQARQREIEPLAARLDRLLPRLGIELPPSPPATPPSPAGEPARAALRMFRNTQARVRERLGRLEDALAADAEIGASRRRRAELQARRGLLEKDLRDLKARRQEARYRLDLRQRETVSAPPETRGELERLRQRRLEYEREHERKVEAATARLEEVEGRLEGVNRQLAALVAERTAIDGMNLGSLRDALDSAVHEVAAAEKRLRSVTGGWRSSLRDAALVDFLAPTVAIHKVVVRDLQQELNFVRVPRVDRCPTCHLNSDSPDFSLLEYRSDRWGSVYARHPRPDLFVASQSPHPVETFGCTSCHGGDGRATDFSLAGHVPSDPATAERWRRDFDWAPPAHQPWPMVPRAFLDASCGKCHRSEDSLPGSGAYRLGRDLVRLYGCYGCHRIEGFEGSLDSESGSAGGFAPRPSPGPNLAFVADKATREFLYRWILDPRAYRESTRMPRFFGLSNRLGHVRAPGPDGEFAEVPLPVRDRVEALALSTWIWTTSGRRGDSLPAPPPVGDPVRGRERFRTSGCLGCHSVIAESEAGPDAGPLADVRPVVAALREAADRAEAVEEARSRRLAERYREVAGRLEALRAWLHTLDPARDVETLYRAVRDPLLAARALEEALSLHGGPLEAAEEYAEDVHRRWIHETFAPDLSSFGSRFDLEDDAGRRRARAWLADWITDPRRHDPSTAMPRLRLEKDPCGGQAIADLVEYLLARRDASFEALAVPDPDALEPEMERELARLFFELVRSERSIEEAGRLARELPARDQLRVVGHRLVRHYGCYGCHRGLSDVDPLAPPAAGSAAAGSPAGESEPAGEPAVTAGAGAAAATSGPEKTFDEEQPMGVDLVGWANKPIDRLDFGSWGHRRDGREAIAHDRYSWLRAKISAPRRFDVVPEPVSTEGRAGGNAYRPGRRLLAKRPLELLRMPRFAFADDPEAVDAIVTYVTSQVKDPIPLARSRRLQGDARLVERGGRLIRRYHCRGCHRIGVDEKRVAIGDLPTWLDVEEKEQRRAETEKETWLSRKTEVRRPRPPGRHGPANLVLPRGMLLNLAVLDPVIDPASDRALDVDPVTVAQVLRRHFDPLPAFVQDLLACLDPYRDEDLVDPDLLRFVKKTLAGEDGEGHAKELLEEMRNAAFEAPEEHGELGEVLTVMIDEPYAERALEWLERAAALREGWEQLERRFYGRIPRRTPAQLQRVAVRGWNEGRVRFYLGRDADTRASAPPPLVREGERVRAQWLLDYLLDVRPIRPWLEVRMPSFRFTQEEARALVAWFRASAGLPLGPEVFPEDRLDRAAAEGGKAIFAALQCNRCHPAGESLPNRPILEAGAGEIDPAHVPIWAPGDSYFLVWRGAGGGIELEGGFPDAEAARAAGRSRFSPGPAAWAVGSPWSKAEWGPDLAVAADRLRPPWVRSWLYSPKDFMPGTRMPMFFGDRDRFLGDYSDLLEPDAAERIGKVTQYVLHVRDMGAVLPPSATSANVPPARK